jgi:hypothetical protein
LRGDKYVEALRAELVLAGLRRTQREALTTTRIEEARSQLSLNWMGGG